MTTRARGKRFALSVLTTAVMAGCATQPPRQASAPPQAPGLPTAWMPYFGVASAAAAAAQITAGGGTVTHGPIPVPGGAHAVMALDPQGAAFGLVGGA